MESAVANQAKQREEYKENTEEVEEALGHTARFRNTVVTLLTMIVVLSVLFELGAERLKHEVPEKTQPVVEILFKELTVLGFIALFVFLAVETGIPQQISDSIFGTPSELKEMFEFVHMLLFLIIVFYLVIVCIVIYRMLSYERAWMRWEGLALHPVDDPTLTRDQAEYLSVRSRFVDCRDKPKYTLSPGFNFAKYLIKHDGHLFEEIVELNPSTWGFVLVLVGLIRLYMMLHSEELKLAIFLVLGFVVFLCGTVVNYKTAKIKSALTGFPRRRAGSWLLGNDNRNPTYGSDGGESGKMPLLPYEKEEDVLEAPQGWFNRFLYGERAPTPHEKLFWFRVNGVSFMLNFIRTSLFLIAIYVALLWVRFSSHFESSEGILLFLGAMFFPTLTVVWLVPAIIEKFTWCTSVEQMRHHRIASRMDHSLRRSRAQMAIRVVKAVRSFAKLSDPKASRATPHMTDVLKRMVHLVFELFDDDLDGYLSWTEFSQLCEKLGMEVPAGGIAEVRAVVNTVGELSDDDLSMEEVEEYVCNMMGSGVTITDNVVNDLLKACNNGAMPEVGCVQAWQVGVFVAGAVGVAEADADVSGVLLDWSCPTDVVGATEIRSLVERC